ncbi:hypothetical protein B4U80_14823 [Leptotrombidium deliense]|uniref:Amine oxidase domain-containing protein n=1 Tax=Leptotrombidium deliense TaxID=299467 RepID=A0A443Q9B6_9ACAR|nr:hypothetical protein B4U80_14823 [Leptotrombidium deliense]
MKTVHSSNKNQFKDVHGLKSSKFNFALFAHYTIAKRGLRPHFHSRSRKSRKQSKILVSISNAVNINDVNVGIVVAGISGLYAALMLQELGINYENLEASDRIGGRHHTHYFDENEAYNYVECGAMRFPRVAEYDRLIGKQAFVIFKQQTG